MVGVCDRVGVEDRREVGLGQVVCLRHFRWRENSPAARSRISYIHHTLSRSATRSITIEHLRPPCLIAWRPKSCSLHGHRLDIFLERSTRTTIFGRQGTTSSGHTLISVNHPLCHATSLHAARKTTSMPDLPFDGSWRPHLEEGSTWKKASCISWDGDEAAAWLIHSSLTALVRHPQYARRRAISKSCECMSCGPAGFSRSVLRTAWVVLCIYIKRIPIDLRWSDKSRRRIYHRRCVSIVPAGDTASCACGVRSRGGHPRPNSSILPRNGAAHLHAMPGSLYGSASSAMQGQPVQATRTCPLVHLVLARPSPVSPVATRLRRMPTWVRRSATPPLCYLESLLCPVAASPDPRYPSCSRVRLQDHALGRQLRQ